MCVRGLGGREGTDCRSRHVCIRPSWCNLKTLTQKTLVCVRACVRTVSFADSVCVCVCNWRQQREERRIVCAYGGGGAGGAGGVGGGSPLVVFQVHPEFPRCYFLHGCLCSTGLITCCD